MQPCWGRVHPEAEGRARALYGPRSDAGSTGAVSVDTATVLIEFLPLAKAVGINTPPQRGAVERRERVTGPTILGILLRARLHRSTSRHAARERR